MVKLLLELTVMLVCIFYGLKKGGALGASVFSIVGIFVLVFGFHIPAAAPAADALLVILAIGISSGVLEASGGMDYLIWLFGKIIEKNAGMINVISPLICFLAVFCTGTSSIILAIEPIIAKTAGQSGTNPKHALVLSANAANMAIICSPAAASTILVIEILAGYSISMIKYYMILLPATIAAIVLTSFLYPLWDKMVAGRNKVDAAPIVEETAGEPEFDQRSKLAVLIFFIGILCIVLFGFKRSWLPSYHTREELLTVKSTSVVQIFMYVTAAINIVLCKVKSKAVLAADILQASVGAALLVFCVGWLGNTIFTFPKNLILVEETIGALVSGNLIVVVLITIVLTAVLGAQTVVVSILFPLFLSAGFPPIYIPVIAQALNAKFVIPAQPIIIAACELDRTGNTKPMNFLMPGFAVIFSAIGLAYLFVQVF